MHDFTPLPALLGGAIIGLAASLFALTHGRVAGVSNLFAGIFRPGIHDRWLRIAFVLGLIVSGLAFRVLRPAAFESGWSPTLPFAMAAGLLVGFGTQLGSGCTSGHGVCGISRLSVRSFVATGTFMATGFATVFVVRHVLGAGR